MEQSFSRIVSDFNETFCTWLFSPKTKSFMLNSLIFTSNAMVTESKVFGQKEPKYHLHSCNFYNKYVLNLWQLVLHNIDLC